MTLLVFGRIEREQSFMKFQMGLRILIFLVILSRTYCFHESGNYLYLSSTSFPVLVVSNDEPWDKDLGSSLVPEDGVHGNRESTTSDKDEVPGGDSAVPPTSRTPIRESLYVVIPMTFIYSLIFITGLIGNISTCIVISRTRILHSATNYYLFSLSVSDLLLLLSGLPQEMYSIWVRYPYLLGEPFCVIRGLAAETSANATVLTITAFTVERYVAICHPLRSHKLSKLSRVVRIIISIWIVALALALPQAARFGLVDEIEDGIVVVKEAWCSIKREFIPYAFEISICVFFVIPMTIMTVLYVLIGLKLRKSRRGPSNVNQEITVEPYRYAQARHSQTHVIRMLVSVVVAFFVCWAPFHCQRLLAIYAQGTKSRTLVTIYDMITHASGILYYLSTCINPVLYNIMSNKFRQAFKDTLSQLFSRHRHPSAIHHRTYSAASNRSSRMGVTHNNQFGQMRGCHDTCVNCRHTPSVCACRGNSTKFVRNYALPPNVDSAELTGSQSQSPYGYSPEVNIPLTTRQSNPNSQRPASKTKVILKMSTKKKVKETSRGGLRTFLMLRRQKNRQSRFLRLIRTKQAPSDPIFGGNLGLLEPTPTSRRRSDSYGCRLSSEKNTSYISSSSDEGSRNRNPYNTTSSIQSDSFISNSSLQGTSCWTPTSTQEEN